MFWGFFNTPITVNNTGNSTAYFDVQYSTDGGTTWSDLQDGNSITSGGSETYSLSSAESHGTTVNFGKIRASNPSSGAYTADAVTINCPVIDASASQALGSCSAGAQVSTITLTNSNSATVTAYFLVEYSLDGGSNWIKSIKSICSCK